MSRDAGGARRAIVAERHQHGQQRLDAVAEAAAEGEQVGRLGIQHAEIGIVADGAAADAIVPSRRRSTARNRQAEGLHGVDPVAGQLRHLVRVVEGGEPLQIDGSEHRWFEHRGPACMLLVFVDDATSRIMHLHFVHMELDLRPSQSHL